MTRKPKIMIIDRDESVIRATKTSVEMQGWEAVPCNYDPSPSRIIDLEEAVKKENPDVVIWEV